MARSDGTVVRVLLCSPSLAGRGGMTTAARMLMQTAEAHLGDVVVSHVATHPARRERTRYAALESLWLTGMAAWRIATTRPDVVHLFVGPRGSLARKSLLAAVAHASGCAVVAHAHSGDLDRALAGETVEGVDADRLEQLLHRVDVLALLRDVPVAERFASAPVCIVANPVPPQDAPPAAARDIDVLYASRLAPEKGVELLAGVVKRLLFVRPDLRITIAGSAVGPVAEEALDVMASQQSVTATGWVSEEAVASLAKRARVLVSPSAVDSLPMSVLTAGACGAYVVATPVGAVPALLDEGRGTIVEPQVEAWVAGVLRALDSIGAAPEAVPGAALRELVRERYAPEAIAVALRQAYETAIRHRSRQTVDATAEEGGS